MAVIVCTPGVRAVNGSTAFPLARAALSRFAWLSIGAGIVVFGLKMGAFLLTGSVGLLSDALESTVNIVAAVVALFALKAARPGDETHHFGHGKAEYLSALVEGGMILLAEGLIMFTATVRLLNPQPLEDVGIGLAIAVLASVINGLVALTLIRAGRAHRSIVLTADGKHLLTDVWTSVGVVVGVFLVALTGFERLDPIIAMIVALNIVVTGVKLIGSSTLGLMDGTLPTEENDLIVDILRALQTEGVTFHALQTREFRPATIRLAAHPGPRCLVHRTRPRPRRGRRGADPHRPTRHRDRHPPGTHRGPPGLGRPTRRRAPHRPVDRATCACEGSRVDVSRGCPGKDSDVLCTPRQ